MVYPHEGLTGYWYLGRPDFEEMTFLEKFLRKGDVFYDVGANAGAYSVFAAGMGCEVVAFEPVPSTFSRLLENAELNKPLTFSLFPCAVGSLAGSLKMSTGLGPGNHVLRDDEVTDSVEVKVVTLDGVIEDSSRPTFIKADVEGYELEMLRGASKVLQSPSLMGLMLETFRPHNWQLPELQAIESILRQNGFLPYRYDVQSNKIEQLIRPQDGENNTFYFRSPEAVSARLSSFGE